MQQPQTISDKDFTHKSMDFAFLKKKGIDLIQQLSGDIWTDYNHHDPGITILEILCYAITELGYQTDSSIEEILTTNLELGAKVPNNAFFSPDKIMSSNPLSINDYRKLVIDAIPYIKNAWITKSKSNPYGYEGLYDILVQLDDDLLKEMEEDNESEVLGDIEDKIAYLLSSHRNICEDFEHLEFLKDDKISIQADIHIKNSVMAERVLATVLHKLEDILTPEVCYYTFQELIQEGHSLDEIINGPLPKHGFIKDRDLKPLLREISLLNIRKAITSVEGVYRVDYLRVFQNGKEVIGTIVLEHNHFARLDLGKGNIVKNRFPLHLFKNNAEIELDLALMYRFLDNLSSSRASYLPLNLVFENIDDYKRAKLKRQIEYHSIQYDFPNNYGLTELGDSLNISALRKAQVKQLKAYLLFFEQILADYQAQIINVRELFSIEGDIKASYFTQLPKNIPHLQSVVEGHNPTIFGESVKQLVDKHDSNIKRKSKAINHLLARFGETKINDIINKYYQNNNYENLANEDILKRKINFLQQYDKLSYNRNRGAYTYDDKKNYRYEFKPASIAERLQLLLDIDMKSIKSLTTAIENSKINIDPQNILDIEEYHDFYETKPLETIKEEDLLLDLIRHGVLLTNYQIIDNSTSDKVEYLAQYISPTEGFRIILKNFKDNNDCKTFIEKFRTYILNINKASKGFYAIENILLRPQTEREYGFNLFDDVYSQSTVLTNLEDGLGDLVSQKLIIEDIKITGLEKKNYYLRNNEETFEIRLENHYGEDIARSSEQFQNRDDANNEIDRIINIIQSMKLGMPTNVEYPLYTFNNPSDKDLYSHRISFFFPNWCCYFHGMDNEKLIREFIYETIPFHLALDIYFLSPEEMKAFEKDYQKWTKFHHEAYEDELEKLKYDVMRHIEDFHEQSNNQKI